MNRPFAENVSTESITNHLVGKHIPCPACQGEIQIYTLKYFVTVIRLYFIPYY